MSLRKVLLFEISDENNIPVKLHSYIFDIEPRCLNISYMPEIIQEWLGTRLGVVLNLSPQSFGKNTKDGVLLSRILYGYGVLPIHILQRVKETKNYYDCYENLKVLKPWLQHIGVKQNDTFLQEVARGEGSSAISLFYAVYLNLERKDTLYYLLAQKERRFSQDSCQRKFKVEWVPEKALLNSAPENQTPPAAVTFLEKSDMIDWHRSKCKQVVKKIQRVKSKFSNATKLKETHRTLKVQKESLSQPLDTKSMEANEVIETLNQFEKRHLQKCPNLTYSELVKLKNKSETQPCLHLTNMEEAKCITRSIKHRRESEVYARNFQENMHHMVLDEHWKEMMDERSRKLEDVVHESLLKQSLSEKRMTSKLCQIRHRKKVFAENRKLIESLKTEQRSKEFDGELIAKMEIREANRRNEEFEREKLAELHKKVYYEKVRARKKFLHRECGCILQCIADIAIRISDVRRTTGCQIPKSLVKDLKELFFKNLPIFDVLNNFEELLVDDLRTTEGTEEDNEVEEGVVYNDYNQMKAEEKHRQNILNETDFTDYMNLLGPWMKELLFPEGSESECQQIVLGYVVHKLLELKYPVPNRPSRVPLKPMLPKAVVQDLDGNSYKMFVDLMETNRILVVHANDAINYVLSAYKDELAVVRDVDITFQNLTNKALQDNENADKDKDVKKKVVLMKKEETENRIDGSEPNSLHKETQTPRKIPEDDPLLSTNAAIGKLAFDALGAGDPVPDIVIVSAIVAYVESKQNDIDGWVLVNYPRLYSQASELECALTGYRLLPLTDQTYTLEDVEGFSFRQPCVDPFSTDDFALNRSSRLVAKPISETTIPENPTSYFNIFIKLRKSADTSKDQIQASSSPEPLQEFYVQQNIFHSFEYSTLNFQTLKTIGKIILKQKFNHIDDDTELMPKTSLELFGSAITVLNDKWDPGKKKNGKGPEKTPHDEQPKTVKTKERLSLVEPRDLPKTYETPQANTTTDGVRTVGKSSMDPHLPAAKPGDPDWEWASGIQSDSLLLALASLWENMEALFVDDLKDVFFCLRTHRSNVLAYCQFIRKSVQNMMRQPDEKQKVVNDFKQMFNEIDQDLRADLDIKCELHVRVSELEEALLGIADERRTSSSEDISKVTQNGWVADEMANLVNHFLSVVQLESDRALATCQILVDYYASLLQRMPEEKVIGRITVAKLQMKGRKYSILSSTSQYESATQISTPRNSEMKRSYRNITDQGTRNNFERVSKTRSWTEKKRKSSDSSFLTGASEIITDILRNLTLPLDRTTPFHGFFKESIQAATTEITALIESYISEAKKGDKSGVKNQKKGSETNPSPGGNASVEWELALSNELSRFTFRMRLILARGIFDMNEFLATMLNVLSSLTEDINEMYLNEVKSISECCKVFRCCIEEEIPLMFNLVLKQDEFWVEEDFSLPKDTGFRYEGVKEDKMRFSVNQLFLLVEKLSRVAPDGEIIKRSFMYILEDLRAFNPEMSSCNCLPEMWRSLEPNDMVHVMNELYQDLEIVHWKDFIIYALNVPIPSENEILFMRKVFREFDPHLTELVTRRDYDEINFWFQSSGSDGSDVDLEKIKGVKDLLFKMYQVDDYQTNYSALLLAFCKDENPIFGFIKALTLVMGKKINTNEYANEDYIFVQGEGEQLEETELFENYHVNNPKKSCPRCLSSAENYYKCVPKERTRCTCGETQKTVNSHEETGPSFSETWASDGAEQGEGETGSPLFSHYKELDDESVVSSVPFTILSSLFKASFPSLSQLSILLDCKQTFEDTLNSIYDAVESRDDRVEVYKLLRHKFISRLIQNTNKFRYLKMEEIVSNKLKGKNLALSSCRLFDQNLCNEFVR